MIEAVITRRSAEDLHLKEGDAVTARRQGEVRRYGVIAGDREALAKSLRALRAPNRRLHFVW